MPKIKSIINLSVVVFWVLTLCSLAGGYKCYGGIFCHVKHLYRRRRMANGNGEYKGKKGKER
jgi:hypothetical protein